MITDAYYGRWGYRGDNFADIWADGYGMGGWGPWGPWGPGGMWGDGGGADCAARCGGFRNWKK